MIVAGTGHRPDKLGGYDTRVRLGLGGLATDYLHRTRPCEVISGMALGWDQALAGAAIALGIPLIAAVPFEAQASRWPSESQARYKRLLSRARHVEIITPGEVYGRLVNDAMDDRNKWMVDRAGRMAALWDGSWGGTFNCVKYAEKRGVQIDNLWDRWTLPPEITELLG